MQTFQGRTAFLTGAASGIGRCIAIELAQAGCNLCLVDVNAEGLKKLAAELEPFRRHCTSRGTCCRFAESGHMLYVTGLEAAGMAASGVTPSLKQSAAGTCPYLHVSSDFQGRKQGLSNSCPKLLVNDLDILERHLC